MTPDDSTVSSLDELADMVAEKFDQYRAPNKFKEVSLVIDRADANRSTLIIHLDGEAAEELAKRVEAHVQTLGARAEREHHSATDIRVLPALD